MVLFMDKLKVFHTGLEEIKSPDVHYGRRNADFGQGFYVSDNEEFVLRWAKSSSGKNSIINYYELDLNGLNVLRLKRGKKWFDYIFKNRSGFTDEYGDADVIIGPVANDTLYDTYGLITSGFLKKEDSLRLLMIGSAYTQIVLKKEKAAKQLKFLSSRVITENEALLYRKTVRQEEREFQSAFNEGLKTLANYEEIADMLE